MIGGIIKFFVKLAVGIMLGLFALIFVVYVLFNGAKTYYEDSRLPYNDASYVVRAHQICESYAVDDTTWHACCIPGCNEYFLKTSPNKNTCSPEHERQYQEIYKAWEATKNGQDDLKKLGIRAK